MIGSKRDPEILKTKPTGTRDEELGIVPEHAIDLDNPRIRNIDHVTFGNREDKLLVELSDGTRWYFKSDNWQAEEAAYIVSRELGLDLVPETVEREIDNIKGVLQKQVNGEKPSWYERGQEWELSDEKIIKLALFDYIIGETDRHRHNIIWDETNDKVWAIDHELSFSNILIPHSLAFNAFVEKGLTLPDSYREKVLDILNDKKNIQTLNDNLVELIGEEKFKFFLARLKKVAKNKFGYRDNIKTEIDELKNSRIIK